VAAWHDWEESLRRSDHQEAWLDVVLNRLDFVRSAIPKEWESNYEESLVSLSRNFSELKNSPAIIIRRAENLMGKQEFANALTLLEETLENGQGDDYPHYRKKIRALVRQIHTVTLFVETEEVYPKDQFPLILLRYKNLDQVSLRLFSIPEEVFIKNQFSRQTSKDTIKTLHGEKLLWQDSILLQESEDYKEHGTEVMIDHELAYGTYALQYNTSRDSTDISGFVLFQVTDLGLMSAGDQNDSELLVMNRNNGTILKDAQVEMRNSAPHSDSYPTRQRLQKKNDRFIFPPARTSNVYFIAEHQGDRYISPLTYLQGPYRYDPEPFRRTILFTDRAIYRPGDIIQFKALTALT